MHSPGLLQSIKEENMSIECYFSACPNHDIHVNRTVTVGFHIGNEYVSYVVDVNRDGLTMAMYLRQMMIIMHCFDVSNLYFEGE